MLPYVIFGSENSIDEDRCYFLNEPISNEKQYYQKLCAELSQCNINANVAFCKNNTIHSCYKGTPDELNNSLLYTYDLHINKQKFTLPVKNYVYRDVGLKILRTIRVLLSFVSRSRFRCEVKKALKSQIFEYKLEILKKCYYDILIFKLNNKINPIEMKKTVAFQIGQTWALIEGLELYTKNSISKHYNQLSDFLNRHINVDDSILSILVTDFLDDISSIIFESNINRVRFSISTKYYTEISTV